MVIKNFRDFLGMLDHEIMEAFYEEHPILPLYGRDSGKVEKGKAIQIAGKL